ncbi:UvrD-helicase domain-containing protein [Candidatus Allofournierella excrementigallinarum]|uniref:UvrD-helicase domain-containing protein n=1 Tax=Candidatus Allofournierella excrementigallinarum TaxID=2838592 RepID=UPI00374E8404
MQFTKDQRAAIDHEGSALLVSAAAGSGKTAVLVERAARLLTRDKDPVPADRLLIVTFTRAAAASLRAKLAARLAEEQLKHPGSAWLRRQRMLLQRASIGTIDSFCLQLVQTHFGKLDIPPDFSTADGPQLARLRAEALAAALENAYADPDFCAFADLYGKGRSDKQAARVLEQLYDFLSSMPFPDASLDKMAADWAADRPLDATEWGKALRAEGARGAKCALSLAQENLAEAEGDGELGNYLPALQSDVAAARAVEAAVASAPWDGILDAFRTLRYQPLKAARGYKGCHAERIKARRDVLKKIFARLQDTVFVCPGAGLAADRAAAAPLVAALARAERDFIARFWQAKCEEKLLEFSDVEHLALRLLQTPEGRRTELADQLWREYAAVMVDEYQDTNALQDALYAALAAPGGEDLFFVGDLKQSIYRFRQADPEVFREKLARYAPHGGAGPQKVFLDANFRSAPGVIDGINAIFEAVMSSEVGGVDYGPGEKLAPGLGGPAAYGGYAGGCEVHVVEGDGGPAAEAAFIARRIREMAGPASNFTVRDGRGGERPAAFEDFCILTRSRSHFDVYADALEAAGIPVYVDRAENLLDAPEVRALASLVRVLDNPAQDVHLAAVMLGLGGFEPDDLVRLRTSQPAGSFYGAVSAAAGGKAAAFMDWLRALQRLAQTLPVDRLMEEIFLRTGCLAAAGAMEEGRSRRQNLRRFAAFAADCGKNGLAGVVRAMDAALAEGGVPGPEQGQSRPGCVSIMTVHRSKGLEFPVVIAAGLDRPFNREDLIAPVVLHPRLGLGLTLRAGTGGAYTTAPLRAAQAAQTADAVSEEMRVFYVAATRAKDRLLLTMSLKNPLGTLERLAAQLTAAGRCQPYLLQHCASRADWVLLALLTHPSAGCLRGLVNAPVPVRPRPLAGALTVAFQQPEDAQPAPAAAAGLPAAAPDAGLAAALAQRLAWRSGRAALQTVPAKVSVTALARTGEELIPARPAFMYKEGLTGAEQGSALHAFLQHADLAAAAKDSEAEGRRQLEAKLLTAEQHHSLPWKALHAFFESDAFARMQAAERVLREYAFITSIPAEQLSPEAAGAGARVLVQGVADVVLEFGDRLEILDYKTDRGKSGEELVRAYAAQLRMYAAAAARRLAKPVKKLTLYSFALGREIDVPLE